MPTNLWDTGGDYYPNFIEQGYQQAIQGGAAGGLRYAPTDQEMEVMVLLILAVVVTVGVAAALAPAAGAAAGGAAAAGGTGAGVAGTAAAGVGASAATTAAAAGTTGAVAATTGATVGAGSAAAATGAAATTGVAASYVLPTVTVTGASAGAAGISGLSTGAIAALAPVAVQLVVPALPAYSPPELLPQAGSGSTTLQSAGPAELPDMTLPRSLFESVEPAGELAEAASVTAPATGAAPAAVGSSVGRVLGTQLLAGAVENLLTPAAPAATPREPASAPPTYDRTEGAKFRPDNLGHGLGKGQGKGQGRSTRGNSRRPPTRPGHPRPAATPPPAGAAPVLKQLDQALTRSRMSVQDAARLLQRQLPALAQAHPDLAEAARRLPGLSSLPHLPADLPLQQALRRLAQPAPQVPSLGTDWDLHMPAWAQRSLDAFNGLTATFVSPGVRQAIGQLSRQLQRAKAAAKQGITDSITASAEVGAAIYEQLNAQATRHPGALAEINRAIDFAKPATALATDLNPQTMTWTDLFNIWMFELGSSNQLDFDENAVTTKRLFQEEGVRNARQLALDQVRAGNFHDRVNLRVDYDVAEFYKSLRQRNEATIFLGTYTVHVTVTNNGNGTATLSFDVENSTSWESGTRFRKAAPGGGAHRGVIPSRERTDGGVHLGGTLYEHWRWKETVPLPKGRR